MSFEDDFFCLLSNGLANDSFPPPRFDDYGINERLGLMIKTMFRSLPTYGASLLARQVSLVLSPHCDRICVVDSLRRQESTHQAIQILTCGLRSKLKAAIANRGNRRRGDMPLWNVLREFTIDVGDLQPAPVGTAIVLIDADGAPVLPCLIVSVEAGQFGIFSLALTGPDSYFQFLLRNLRPGFSVREGWLWEGQSKIDCQTESELQQFLSVQLLQPHFRGMWERCGAGGGPATQDSFPPGDLS